MKKIYRAPYALLFSMQVRDIIAASNEPNEPDDSNPSDDPTKPGPGGDTSTTPSTSDPAAPDLDWN